jgi:hypothetical protein
MSQTEAPKPEAVFLELTFDGGRFASHSLPVDAAEELMTVQELIEKVARHLFLLENQGKQRVPKGFFNSAQLYLVSSVDNCFTAKLQRSAGTKPGLFDTSLFEKSRNLVLSALLAISINQALPAEFPQNAVSSLVSLGRRLNDDESLKLSDTDKTIAATVTQETRKRLAKQVNKPLERIEIVDGEIDEFDDTKSTFQLRTREKGTIEVAFHRVEKDRLLEAIKNRPIERVQVRGKLIYSQTQKKISQVEELEIIDHERSVDIQKMWDRLRSFEQIESGWIEGEGVSPTEVALTRAKDALARVMADDAQIERPRVYPTPNGGVQAEWILGDWAIDLKFDPSEDEILAEATNATTCEDRSEQFTSQQVNANEATPLINWLVSLT